MGIAPHLLHDTQAKSLGQLPTHNYFAHRGTKAISIPKALLMASRSILASVPAIVELPSPSPGDLRGMLHELHGHPLGTELLCKVIRWTLSYQFSLQESTARGWGEGTGTLPAGGPGCC